MSRYLYLCGALMLAVIIVAAWPAQAQTNACQAAEREMVYGTVALEDAKDKKGFLESAKQFQAAVAKAPNCAQAHFNLGVVYEKAGEYQKAVGPLQTYLKLLPNADDAAQVKKKIYALEYRAQKASRARAEQPPPTPKRPLSDLNGRWCGSKKFTCFTLNVLGNSFEATLFGWCSQTYHGRYVMYQGVIDNQMKITGKRNLNCPDQRCQPDFAITGSISQDFKKIMISGRKATSISGDFCQVLEYSNDLTVKEWTKQ